MERFHGPCNRAMVPLGGFQTGLAVGFLMLLGGAAAPIEQVGASDRATGTAETVQVEVPSKDKAIVPPIHEPVRAKADGQPLPQLTVESRQVKSVSQLAPEGQRARSPSQLHDAKKTAEPSPALASREEGRETDVIVVQGIDRCDAQRAPGAKKSNKHDVDCSNLIEDRAREFSRPDPVALSNEEKAQVLLPRLGELQTVDLTTRRLAGDGVPRSPLDQEVAAVVFEPASLPPDLPAETSGGKLPGGSSVLIDLRAVGSAGQR